MLEKSKLKQSQLHGTQSFPLCVYQNDVGNNKTILDCHWHDEIEIIYFKKGKATFFIDTQPVYLEEGQAIFINRRQLHVGYSSGESHCIYHPIVFDLNMLGSTSYDACHEKFISPLLSGAFMLPMVVIGQNHWESEVLLLLQKIIRSYLSKDPFMEITIKASLYNILAILWENNKISPVYGQKFTPYDKLTKIKQIIMFIDQNYNQKISNEMLAAVLNMNPQYFCRFFKKNIGQSPFEYINFIRIEKAVAFILYSTSKLTDIALQVGYDNPSYFITMFKRYKKCTPSSLRKLHKPIQ